MVVDLKRAFYVKPGDVYRAGLGITPKMFRKAREAGVLEGFVPPGMRQRVYRRDDVLRVFGITEESKHE
jgi:hypothetical protein